jgi:hypothetical protein
LANSDDTRVRAATVDLIAVALISAHDRLSFVHPLVRAAVYQDIAVPVRAQFHEAAAMLLADDPAQILDDWLVTAEPHPPPRPRRSRPQLAGAREATGTRSCGMPAGPRVWSVPRASRELHPRPIIVASWETRPAPVARRPRERGHTPGRLPPRHRADGPPPAPEHHVAVRSPGAASDSASSVATSTTRSS